MLSVVPTQCLGYTAKNFWPKVLSSVVIQLYVGECTPSGLSPEDIFVPEPLEML